MTDLLTMGTMGLGRPTVKGRSREPSPPAIKTAFTNPPSVDIWTTTLRWNYHARNPATLSLVGTLPGFLLNLLACSTAGEVCAFMVLATQLRGLDRRPGVVTSVGKWRRESMRLQEYLSAFNKGHSLIAADKLAEGVAKLTVLIK